jgi:hypothetical protein
MTEADYAAYAAAQRAACRPIECTGAANCWSALGTSDTLMKHGAPTCDACAGIVRHENWRPPGLMALPRSPGQNTRGGNPHRGGVSGGQASGAGLK